MMDFSLRKTKKWHGSARYKPEKKIKIYVRSIFDAVKSSNGYQGRLFCLNFHYIMIHELIHIILWDFNLRGISTHNEELVEHYANSICHEEMRFRKDGVLPFPLSIFNLLKHDLGNDNEKNIVFV